MTIQSEIIKEVSACNGTLKKYSTGVLHFQKNDEITKSSREGTKQLFDAITEIQKDEKSLIVLNLKGLTDMEMDCRMFLMNSLPDISNGIAFVIDDDPVIRSQFNMSSYLRKKTIPIDFFHSDDEAFNWISSL